MWQWNVSHLQKQCSFYFNKYSIEFSQTQFFPVSIVKNNSILVFFRLMKFFGDNILGTQIRILVSNWSGQSPSCRLFLYILNATSKFVPIKAVFSIAPISTVKANTFTMITKAEDKYVSWKIGATVLKSFCIKELL